MKVTLHESYTKEQMIVVALLWDMFAKSHCAHWEVESVSQAQQLHHLWTIVLKVTGDKYLDQMFELNSLAMKMHVNGNVGLLVGRASGEQTDEEVVGRKSHD